MKKLFTLLFISTLFISCSQDNDVADMEQEALSFEEKLARGDFDDSNLGIYEGVFASLTSDSRSTVRIDLDGKSNPVAYFGFPNGDLKSFRSTEKLSKAQEGSIHFSGEDFDFDFEVDADGLNPIVSNATFKGEKGDMLLVKETSKQAVTPRTGTYECTPNGCDTHPDLGVGKSQTFNAILTVATGGTTSNGGQIAANESESKSNLIFQVVLGGTTYFMDSSTPSMTQGSCVERSRTIGPVVFAVTRCQFSGNIRGGSGLATITGTHRYGRDVTFSGTTSDFNCSDYFGDFVYNSTILGTSTMQFTSDDVEGQDDYCFPTENP